MEAPLSWLMTCLSSASPAQWHPWCVASPGCVCHVCLYLMARCRVLCLSDAFGSACSHNRNVGVSVPNPEIKNGCKQNHQVLTRNTLKTPAETESTQWEHQVCVQHFALESTGFWHSFLQTAIGGGSSRRGKHQQFVEFCVGTEEALICSNYIHVLL